MEFGQILGKQATFSFSYKIRVNYHLKLAGKQSIVSNWESWPHNTTRMFIFSSKKMDNACNIEARMIFKVLSKCVKGVSF